MKSSSPIFLRIVSTFSLLLSATTYAEEIYTQNFDKEKDQTVTVESGSTASLSDLPFSASVGKGSVTLKVEDGVGKDKKGLDFRVFDPISEFSTLSIRDIAIPKIDPTALESKNLVGITLSFDVKCSEGRALDCYLEFAPNGPNNMQYWADNAPFENRLALGRVIGKNSFDNVEFKVEESVIEKFLAFAIRTGSPEFRFNIVWAIGSPELWKVDDGFSIDNIVILKP